jgi:diguanylate cyclase (GGDEF)-like protein
MAISQKRRKLREKLILLLVLLGLLPLLVAFISSYYSQKATLTTTMGRAFEGVAKETSFKLAFMLEELVSRSQNIAGEPAFRRILRHSNVSYAGLVSVEDELREKSRRWADLAPAERTQMMEPETSGILRDIVSRAVGLYEELLVVDREGALLAAAGTPRHYTYRDTVWRVAAFSEGEGEVFVGDIAWDGDRKRYALPVAVPIRDEDGVQGVLLAVHTIDRVFRSVTGVHLGKSDHTMLANSVGDLLFCPIFQIRNHTLSEALVGIVAKPNPGWTVSEVDVHYPGRDVINGYAPVKLNVPGMSMKSLGEKQWFIFTSQNPEETYAPLGTLLRWTALSAILGVAILVTLAIVVSRHIVNPIMKLEGATREIISGIVHLPQPAVGSPAIAFPAEGKKTSREGPPLGISTGDEIEGLAHSFSKINDVLDRTREQLAVTTRRLEEMATTDELTQLYNRHFIWRELKGEFARSLRFNLDLSCLMIDLDFFKDINDRYGHQAGDRILKEFSVLLQENSRELDTLARFGGEEFLAILPQTDSKGAKIQAERIRDEVANHSFSIDDQATLRLTISIGIASYPDSRIRVMEDLIKIADEALYASKAQGRNRVSLG